jgi:uncharacterized membrane protein YGL010W
MDAWVDRYEKSHQNPINRVFPTFGILHDRSFNSALSDRSAGSGFWKIPLSLFTAGWIYQVLGYLIEGKPPEFSKDWRFLLVGPRWWL